LQQRLVKSGDALLVQSGNGGTSRVVVSRSVAHDYQKNGFTGNDEGTTFMVEESSARGSGPTTGAAQNGIQIGFGATGRIERNRVIDHIWALCTSISSCMAVATGILVVNAPSVVTRDNVEGNSQSASTVQ
jgi:hypothetical protein